MTLATYRPIVDATLQALSESDSVGTGQAWVPASRDLIGALLASRWDEAGLERKLYYAWRERLIDEVMGLHVGPTPVASTEASQASRIDRAVSEYGMRERSLLEQVASGWSITETELREGIARGVRA